MLPYVKTRVYVPWFLMIFYTKNKFDLKSLPSVIFNMIPVDLFIYFCHKTEQTQSKEIFNENFFEGTFWVYYLEATLYYHGEK